VVRCSKSLPLCPRGPDGGIGTDWRHPEPLPLCPPRGPDSGSGGAEGGGEVAPVPAWAGRDCDQAGTDGHSLPLFPRGPDETRLSSPSLERRCPCARVGRTPIHVALGGIPDVAPVPAWARHGKHWDLTLWKARKCPKVGGGLPMGAGDPRRGLPAGTASGQGQAFQVSGPNPGDRSREGACRPEL